MRPAKLSWRMSACVHRAPHKEAAAAGFEPAGPFVTWGQSGYFEGRRTLALKWTRHSPLFLSWPWFPFASPGTSGVFPACDWPSGQEQNDPQQCLCCHDTQHLHVQGLSLQGYRTTGVLHGNQHSQHRPAADQIPESSVDREDQKGPLSLIYSACHSNCHHKQLLISIRVNTFITEIDGEHFFQCILIRHSYSQKPYFSMEHGGWYGVCRRYQISLLSCVSWLQIPKFIVTQVRQQNMESQRKQNKERAVRKLLKKITTDKPADKAVPEVGVLVSCLCCSTYVWEISVNKPLFHRGFFIIFTM